MDKITAGYTHIPEVSSEMDVLDYLGFIIISSAVFIVIYKVTSN